MADKMEMYQDVFGKFGEDKGNAKAKAFDKLAELYYDHNFGSTSKSEVDLLMFSLLFDKLLEKNKDNEDAYSPYELSKLLCVPQSRIASLKTRKQLKYPYIKNDWRNKLPKIFENAQYDEHKIKLYFKDRNLLLEVKNEIETRGGYIEMTLNPNLLQVSPKYILDLIIAISDEKDRNVLYDVVRQRCGENKLDIVALERETIADKLKQIAVETGEDTFKEILTELSDHGVKIATKFIKSVASKKIKEYL